MLNAIMHGATNARCGVSGSFPIGSTALQSNDCLQDVPHRELNLARRSETFRPSEGVEELSEAGRRQKIGVRRRGQLKPVDDVVDLDSQLHFLAGTQR